MKGAGDSGLCLNWLPGFQAPFWTKELMTLEWRASEVAGLGLSDLQLL